MKTKLTNVALAFGLSTSTLFSAHAAPPEETRAIAKEAWLYAFPMMESYNTWYAQAVATNSPTYVGGFNQFGHYSKAFTPANHDVVTPNNDTPYSWAWLDLRAEPIVISVPKVPKDRYYVLQFMDLFTYNNAYIGSRATGNGAGDFLMVGPRWEGKAPPGFKKMFKSETEIVGILGRTQLNGPDDVENVRELQAGFKLTPLSTFQQIDAPLPTPPLDFPPYDKAKASSHDFIEYLNFFLALAEPPHPKELALRKRFAEIGIAADAPWDSSKMDPAILAAIDAGVKDAQAALKAKLESTLSSNGLFGSRDALGEDYLTRCAAAAKGLYGSYPGLSARAVSTPTGLRHLRLATPQPRWGCLYLARFPRVARASQPGLWAGIPLGFNAGISEKH